MAWTRWYILFVFSSLATQFMMNWFIFGSITKQTQQYYHLSTPSSGSVNHQIAMLLSFGPFFFVLASPFAVFVLRIPIYGLQRSLRVGALCELIGISLICVPSVLSLQPLQSIFRYHYQINGSFLNTMIWLYLGAMINASAAPFILSAPTKLSVMWFAQNERNTISGFASSVSQLGQCLMFFIPPLIVKVPGDLPNLLFIALSSSLFNCCMVFVYFPPHPKLINFHRFLFVIKLID